MKKTFIFFTLLFFVTCTFAQSLPSITLVDEHEEVPLDLLENGTLNLHDANASKVPQKELIIIDSTHPYNLNAHTASYASEAQILLNIYEGLFSYNPITLEPELALCDGFKVSRNKLTWTFTLKKDATLSDGTPITAELLRESWLRLLNPATNAPFASLIDCIKGVQDYRTGKNTDEESVGIVAKDNYTLVVRLNAPTEHLAKLLCHHAFALVPQKDGVYSGAFLLEEFTPSHIILTKNHLYWDAENVNLPSVRYVFSDDSEGNTYLFNIGEAHWVAGPVDTRYILDGSAVHYSSQFGTEYYFFKCATGPLADTRVRSALIYALPQETLRQSSLIGTMTLVLPLAGYPEIYGVPDQDIESAKQLLQDAGFNAENPLEITLCLTDDNTSKARAATLADAWKQIGVSTKAIFLPANEYIGAIKTTKADMFSYIWIGDFADPLAFLELFRSSSTLNETGWQNAKYDSLLEEASRITDNTKRYEKLAEAEQLLLDEAVILPLSHTVSLNIVDKSIIAGWYDNALDIHPLKYIRFIEKAIPKNIVKK